MTESPLRNILEIYLSLLTACAFFPLLPLGTSVQSSWTFSRTLNNKITLMYHIHVAIECFYPGEYFPIVP
jgi:hypothetical protein